jgi:Cdc6-like AAA superfamily ATPase
MLWEDLDMALSHEEQIKKRLEAGRVFTPSAPIEQDTLFAGRTAQINRVIDVIGQRGQHAILFGERGVGKTSLANVLSPLLRGAGKSIIAPHVTCNSNDTFSTVWKKALSHVTFEEKTRAAGFLAEPRTESITLASKIAGEATPDSITDIFTQIGWSALFIIIIDEFDVLTARDGRRLFADTIKALSDHSIGVTLLLVGVADDATDLIEAHESVGRALVQIHLPRMTRSELVEVIDKGLKQLQMTIDEAAKLRIAGLSRGLPNFTHALALHACRATIERGELHITMDDVDHAIRGALDDSQPSIKSAHTKAITSPRKDTIYRQVLLAASLAEPDELGFFAAGDLRSPMKSITGRDYEIPSFSRHLHDFCSVERGNVLEKRGPKHRVRFRFKNPLMQVHVLMKGIADKAIPVASALSG